MQKRELDLSPARWIWAPSGRTLPNTFVCFRRDLTVGEGLVSAEGWLLACSRYVLSVNGRRVQFGPAPADPRYEEADRVDLTGLLAPGENTLGVRVVYFGHGDGTWAAGRAGLLYRIELRYRDGRREVLLSGRETCCRFDRSHPAGQYKRWYLRALQEEYDARRDTLGFDRPDYPHKELFEPAMELPGRADKPSSLNGNSDYLYDGIPQDTENACIRRRELPMPREEFVPARELYHCGTVEWRADPEDWFQFRRPGIFTAREGLEVESGPEGWSFRMPEGRAAALTFRMPEEGCGFLDLTVHAPDGAVVEAMVQEGHDKRNTLWLDTQFFSWTRFVCREGENHFVSFDFECFAYLQLHIRGVEAGETVRVERAGMLRRTYPDREAVLKTDDPAVQKLFGAAVNTLRNSAVETFADGMARERQQYSGDGNHQVYAFSYLYGADDPLVRRYYETFSDGLTLDGYYTDCWPAYDRMNRMAQRQLGMTAWGPVLDHSVEFVMAVRDYTLHSGDPAILEKCWPGFRKLACFLLGLRGKDGLVRVEDTGVPAVWLDVSAFRRQRDKKCVFNLHVAAMLRDALAPLARRQGEEALAREYERQAESLLARTGEIYWDPEAGLFFDNLPTWREDGGKVTSDRTLAVALLHGFLPGDGREAVRALAEKPDFLLLSYPANAVWRLKALAQAGRCDAVTEEFRTLWTRMDSLEYNNTLQEGYRMRPDSTDEWSHCPLAPGLAPFEYYGGLRCEEEGFRRFSLRPCLGGLPSLEFLARTPSGELRFTYRDGFLQTEFGPAMEGTLCLPGRDPVPLESGKRYELPPQAR